MVGEWVECQTAGSGGLDLTPRPACLPSEKEPTGSVTPRLAIRLEHSIRVRTPADTEIRG